MTRESAPWWDGLDDETTVLVYARAMAGYADCYQHKWFEDGDWWDSKAALLRAQAEDPALLVPLAAWVRTSEPDAMTEWVHDLEFEPTDLTAVQEPLLNALALTGTARTLAALITAHPDTVPVRDDDPELADMHALRNTALRLTDDLTATQLDTLEKLAPNWAGTAGDLVHAARTL